MDFARYPVHAHRQRGHMLGGQRFVRATCSRCSILRPTRDEEVFERRRRSTSAAPQPHIAFGIGEHFCLGANLARLELQVMFRQLAERMGFVELAGPVQRMRSSFVGGIKHMPIRYRIRARV